MKAFSSPVCKANCNLTCNKKYSKEAINAKLCLIVAHRIDIMFFFCLFVWLKHFSDWDIVMFVFQLQWNQLIRILA